MRAIVVLEIAIASDNWKFVIFELPQINLNAIKSD